ncbi:hypothetical protein [Microbacterium marinilacus]|uniref:Uncharacterized protein n=1 Tax=Microbacterium marinilacus TaxID=415209 RepID=A0ABP7BCM4_9MICO|nr:hypothetical protein [Microbacterium marinilacus]MBY0689344.1 hypothetical protein [Microbacterium marinilacus]
MFIISLVLFLGGFGLFALAFNIEILQGVVFTAGILAISLAMALPMHFSKTRQ